MAVPFIYFFLFSILTGCSLARYTPPQERPPICHQGQAYWCKNITTAAECNAVNHCIHGVWELEIPIEVDKSSVCQTCMEMVQLARDQLRSNETEQELMEVLGAPCKIVPVRILKEDCFKLMDDFGLYLVDTLSSQMNPQVVCSVAGLCNSNRFVAQSSDDTSVSTKVELNCDNCHGLMKQIEGNIETATSEDLFEVLAGICGYMGSFSDGCTTLIHQNLEKVDALIRSNVKANPVCSVAGVCKERFHSHASPKLIRVPIGDVEIIGRNNGDDLPCDLCVQLVKHLKDVLVANTTVAEFKEVLIGICKLTPYENECDAMVEQYYGAVYNFLVDELDGKLLCAQIRICPNNNSGYIRPLLLVDEAKKKQQPQQLPINRMFPLTFVTPSSLGGVRTHPELCAFCEYFLHFIQKEITLPSSEKEITDAVTKACNKLPITVAEQCDSFVQTYMATFIALLAEKIDPSQVCPNLGVCPGTLVAVEFNDKPTCPLCLLAVEATLAKISNKTELEVNDALDDLCIRDVFPNTLSTECVKFITDYRNELTNMLIAEFTPQEACVYAELCAVPKHPAILPHRLEPTEQSLVSAGNTETNEIIQNVDGSNLCVLCEFVMSKVENELKDKKTEEEIKEAVFKVCNYMPKTVTAQCKSFVQQYADFILDLLAQEMEPKEICTALNLCGNASLLIRSPIKRCLMCELLMDGLKTVLTEPEVSDDMNHNLLRACNYFPEDHIQFCRTMVHELLPQLEQALRTLPVGPLVCHRIQMCINHGNRAQLVKMAGTKGKCYIGPDYWCKNTTTAARCQQIEYCQKHVWRSDKPRKVIKKGSIIY